MWFLIMHIKTVQLQKGIHGKSSVIKVFRLNYNFKAEFPS